jgi:HEPN domain-containing protein
MKRQTAQWVKKAEDDMQNARLLASRLPVLRDVVCFHCHEAAEKHLKALLQDLGAAVPKTHNLTDLLRLLLPHDAALAPLRRRLASLARYDEDFLYPDNNATTREMHSALRNAERVRSELRERLGLPP